MAKYTREQRQRAVELYVKYECCAADVIRELGYPSREALRMWHRDWLDEQETGVSSQRGERYAVLLQCLFDRFGSVFPQCGLMVFPGVVIVSR
ncbi:hypothetical protein [Bifidobacterium longum]|uniref:hypothetical protein n=1 Tax=Bifidobacterium longum TaxID=216816 RepID=UPI0035697844